KAPRLTACTALSIVPWAVMMSTGNRRCCAWSASMSWTPSIGPMRRSMSARSNRCTVAASSARRGSPTGVTSKPIAARRIVSTSRIAASSSTTRTFRVTVAGSAGPARSVGGRGTDRPSSAGFARATDPGGGSEGAVEAPFDDLGGLRRRGSLLLSAALDAEVELLQPLEVRLALGEVLAEPRDLPLERENRRHRVPAHPDPRVRAVSREAQARAAPLAVGLAVGLEHVQQRIGGDADARVLDLELELRAGVDHSHDDAPPARGEADRVGAEVDDQLVEALLVAAIRKVRS